MGDPTSTQRALRVCAIAILILAVSVVSAFAADVVSTPDEAIKLVRAHVSAEYLFDSVQLESLDATATSKSLRGRTFWVVDLTRLDGSRATRVVVSAENGTIVSDKPVLVAFDAWEAYLESYGFVGNLTWAIVGLVVGLLGAVGVYFWARKPRSGVIAWIARICLGFFFSAYLFAVIGSADLQDWRGTASTLIPVLAMTGAWGVALWQRRSSEPQMSVAETVSAVTATDATSPLGVSTAPVPAAGAAAGGGPSSKPKLRVIEPSSLPTFADVGGMEPVKEQLRETVGMLMSHGDLARQYGIDWNGLLLYGPPGTGKTFIAKATAGEFGLNFIDVRVSDVVSKYVGESTKMLSELFAEAAKHRPCILFFDEFDSIAQRRDDASWDTESTRIVNQLLRELEASREVPDFFVVAATNSKDSLDEAAIRPGRFDRQIHVGMPDADARRKVFSANLRSKPVAPDLDLDELVALTDGMSAADITAVVNAAAMEAVRLTVRSGRAPEEEGHPITSDLLLGAIRAMRAKVRPSVSVTSWDDLVLDPKTKRTLIELEEQIENYDDLVLRGIEPPRGVLLYGPPGTGKTTIAKVLASQTDAAFFSVDATSVVSMWLGESQKQIARVFDEARRLRPSIIFIDEIDAIAPSRAGGFDYMNDVTSQFLREIDGVESAGGVFVVGATNIPDALDPALLRGGRLSRQIRIPLPGVRERAQLFAVHARGMKLDPDVDFDALAAATAELSGADIEEICDAAAMSAYRRGAESVSAADLDAARVRYLSERRKPGSRWGNEESSSATGFGFASVPAANTKKGPDA